MKKILAILLLTSAQAFAAPKLTDDEITRAVNEIHSSFSDAMPLKSAIRLSPTWAVTSVTIKKDGGVYLVKTCNVRKTGATASWTCD